MLYKIWSKHGKDHLWAYENFQIETKALLIEHNLSGNFIKSIIYSTKNPVDKEVFDKYEMNYSILEETKTYDQYLEECKPKIIAKPYQKKIERYQPQTNEVQKVLSKCDKCLYWNDDKEKCDKIGSCNMQ